MIETDLWPFVEAKHYTKGDGTRKVRVIVIHDAEFPEKEHAARGVAQYFATTDREASAHVTCDNVEIIQSVHDKDVAYGAKGCNRDGIHIELVGYGNQTATQWRDPYSMGVLALGAKAAAQYCLKFGVPPIRLTDAQLLAGLSGVVGHDQVSRVYPSNGHTDPGPNFPWPSFMSAVVAQYALRKASR